jgi:RHS repeat-associated protein
MRISINGVPAGSNTNNMFLTDPNGTQLVGGGMGWTDVITPMVAGTYTIKVDFLGMATGTATATLYNVPVDSTTNVTFPAVGSSVQASATSTTPGQDSKVTFDISSVTPGMRIAINGVQAGSNTNNMFLTDPNGTQLFGGGMGWTDLLTPTVAGTYTIRVDFLGMATGTATATLYNVPADATTSMSFPAPGSSTQASVTTTTPAQNATVTFDATSGSTVTFTFDESAISGCCNQFTVLNPSGSTLSSTGAGTVGPLSLPETGTYTIKINYSGLNVGTGSVTLTAPVFGLVTRSGNGIQGRALSSTSAGGDPPRPVPAPTTKAASPSPSTTTGGGQTGPAVSQAEWAPRMLKGGNLDYQIYTPLQPNRFKDLRAPPGVTALAGQSLQLDGKPLAGVTFSIGTRSAWTDGSGRFLLTGVPSGRQILHIDGTTANRKGAAYGTYEVAVQIVAGKTNSLGFTNWMAKLDMAHATTISSPTKSEVVITTPLIPGLEVRLPAGTVIKDDDGNAITQLSITPIPVNRPPFPLPLGVQVPIYFTVQPGSTYIYPMGATLVYPNYAHQAPGARVEFWNYDSDEKGWYVYGHGTVTNDGKQVVPDRGVVIYEFSGAMINSGFLTWLLGKLKDLWNYDGDPVELSNGDFVLDKADLVLPGAMPLSVAREYNAVDSVSRSFGLGSTLSYDINLNSTNQYQVVDLYLPGFGPIHYVRTSPGTGFADAVFQTTATPGNFYKSTISWNGNGWNLKLRDGTLYVFGENAPLQAIIDAYGNQISLIRSQGKLGNITMVVSSSGRWIKFTYDGSNRITQAKDNSGRTVLYGYDTGGRLQTVTDPNSGITRYGYDSNNRLITITDPLNFLYLTNHYDSNGRISQQDLVNTSQHFLFAYTLDGNGKVTKTTVTDPRGVRREVMFNGDGFSVKDTADLGGPIQEMTQIQRQPGTGLVTSVTDPLNRVTNLGYDSAGNISSITLMFGTPEARTYQFVYEPVRNRLQTFTDPRQKSTSISYDDVNRTQTVTDAIGHQTVIQLNSSGQQTTVTDPLQHTWTFGYQFGDPATFTDPLGNVSSIVYDGAGRQIAWVDALGQITTASYDPLNEVTKVTDPLNLTNTFVYDANGNLKSVTDPRSGVTRYAYDSSNRVSARTDPDNRIENFNSYDANGNLTSFTDQKGQIICLSYDDLNRLTFIGFAANKLCTLSPTYQSRITYTYDLGNRVHTIADSANGTITRDWTDFDQLNDEVTPQGTVSYTYDAANRIQTITVPGQTAYTYQFDDANRLESIQQGATTLLSLSVDNANRVSSQTLPDGIVETYGYDNANRLSGITYTKGGTTLGTLTYGPDKVGRVATVAGSWARTSIPAALTSATYDAANQVIKRGKNFTYDANGNLTSDGTNTYGWNARDQLTSTNSGGTVTYKYDALGRRISTTSGATTTAYLYAGPNPVQEITNGTVTANQVPTLAADANVARTDSTGTNSYLSDGLGSTVALASSSGTVQTQYTYDPFGATTVTGPTSTNSYQFTGRQNDASGLYYYRARYYSPTQQRFISSDPASFEGGDTNLYAYAHDSPTNLTDPSGLVAVADTVVACAVGAAIGAAMTWIENQLAGRKTTVGDLVTSAAVGCVIGALFTIVGPFVGDLLFGAEGGAGAAGTAARVFWSGGTRQIAEEWAAANGARTLGQTATGQFLEAMTRGAPWSEVEPAWQILSQAFARGASGEVNVFLGPTVREGSIWATKEFPELLKNPTLTKIIFHHIE